MIFNIWMLFSDGQVLDGLYGFVALSGIKSSNFEAPQMAIT